MNNPTPQQKLLFDLPAQPTIAPPRRNKRGKERVTTIAASATSQAGFEVAKRFRGKRYRAILRAVAPFGPEAKDCLTSLEVLRKLYAQGDVPNAETPNLVRPRLTEARNAGLLENPAAPGPFDEEGNPKPFLKKVDNEPPIEDRVRMLEGEIAELREQIATLTRRQNFPQYLSVEEVAQMLHLSPRTIHDMVSARRIPFHKAGSTTRFLLSEIIDWTAGRRNDKNRLQVVR